MNNNFIDIFYFLAYYYPNIWIYFIHSTLLSYFINYFKLYSI